MRLACGENLKFLGKKLVFLDRVVEPWPSKALTAKQKADGDAWNAKFIKLLLKWGLLEPEVFVAVGVRPGPRQPRSLTAHDTLFHSYFIGGGQTTGGGGRVPRAAVL